VSPGSAITGESTITVNGTNAAMVGNPFVHSNDAVSISAQSELAAAKSELGSLGAGTTLPVNLGGLTLSPGVYTVPAGTTNLTGTLTLKALTVRPFSFAHLLCPPLFQDLTCWIEANVIGE